LDKTELLLQELCDAYGPPGHESEVAGIMNRHLKPVSDKIDYDKLGSILAHKRGNTDSPRIMLAGHMDEIGFVVSNISKKGFVRFLPLGGWWGHVALAQRVVVMTSKGPVVGVVGSTPPHVLAPKDRKNVLDIDQMFIDVGAKDNYDVEKKLGVRVGDAIVPYSPFSIMNHKKMYLAKAFDNRIGCAAVIQVLEKLGSVKHPNTVIGVGTVQEEVGLRGAGTSAYACEPDVGIALDVTIARDTPGMKGDKVESLGAGPAILVYDAGLIPNVKLKKLVIDTAEDLKMSYRLGTLGRGATDAGKIHQTRYGVPSICIALPTRYIHGHTSIIYRDDYLNVVKLTTEVVKRLDKKTVESFTRP